MYAICPSSYLILGDKKKCPVINLLELHAEFYKIGTRYQKKLLLNSILCSIVFKTNGKQFDTKKIACAANSEWIVIVGAISDQPKLSNLLFGQK